MIGDLALSFMITCCLWSISKTVARPVNPFSKANDYRPESHISIPEVFAESHWKHQFLDLVTARDNMWKNRESCLSLGSWLISHNIYVSVAVPKGSTVVLPCIYCGAYVRQEKHWFKADFSWSIDWDEPGKSSRIQYHRRLFNISTQEAISGQPDKLYKTVQRKDDAFVITEFDEKDTGLFSCHHNFSIDIKIGRMTYILDVISGHQHVTEGGFLELKQYKESVDNLNREIQAEGNSFFSDTHFETHLVSKGICEGICRGEPGYRGEYYTSYLVHNDSEPLEMFHPSFSAFSFSIHVRAMQLKKVDSALAKKLHYLEDFYFYSPCNSEELCPDPEGPPSSSKENIPYTTKEGQILIAENMEKLTRNRVEVSHTRSRGAIYFKLNCFMEVQEEAVWLYTNLQNKTIELSKSTWSMLKEQAVNMVDVTEEYKLDVSGKIGRNNVPLMFDRIGKDQAGTFHCYSYDKDLKRIRKRKEYYIFAESVLDLMLEWLVIFIEDYFVIIILLLALIL
ncbi:uncharacterized protein [Palaemon carinicauda]|uniref:uncharacterized protein n=1 Tax=Palaemon carinicauda TaxID=392227 RepID=UPI0035B61ACF